MTKYETDNMTLTETQTKWLDKHGIKYDGRTFSKGLNAPGLVWFNVDSIWDVKEDKEVIRCSSLRWTCGVGGPYVHGTDLYVGASLKTALAHLAKCQPREE